MKKINSLIFLVLSFFVLDACNQDYTPRPRGYFRIDLPEKEYVLFDTTYQN